MRRVVIGQGDDGRSTVVVTGPPSRVFAGGALVDGLPASIGPGAAAVAELWATHSGPPTVAEAAAERLPEAWNIECGPGATRWRYIEFGPGLSAGLHSTTTLDYSFIVAGEVTLLLGDGTEIALTAGDAVVIPGLEHGWRTGDVGCTKLLVMTGLADEAANDSPAQRAAERYIELINAGRYDEVGSLFADDAEWYGFGRDPRRGRDAISEGYLAHLSAITPTIRAGSIVSDEHRSVVELEVRSRETGEWGPGPIDHFTVDADGLISRFAVYDQPRWEPEPD